MASAVQLVVEGRLDQAVGIRLLQSHGIAVATTLIKGGRSQIETKIRGYYAASVTSPWVILADLDSDCAPALLAKWNVPNAGERFVCRLVEREIESWLLADAKGIASELHVSVARVPQNPDFLPDPKRELINLARNSRSRSVREDIVPTAQSLIRTGPGYNTRLSNFARDIWSMQDAARNSPSLARSIAAIKELAQRI